MDKGKFQNIEADPGEVEFMPGIFVSSNLQQPAKAAEEAAGPTFGASMPERAERSEPPVIPPETVKKLTRAYRAIPGEVRGTLAGLTFDDLEEMLRNGTRKAALAAASEAVRRHVEETKEEGAAI